MVKHRPQTVTGGKRKRTAENTAHCSACFGNVDGFVRHGIRPRFSGANAC